MVPLGLKMLLMLLMLFMGIGQVTPHSWVRTSNFIYCVLLLTFSYRLMTFRSKALVSLGTYEPTVPPPPPLFQLLFPLTYPAGRDSQVDVHNTYQPTQRSSLVCKPPSQSNPTVQLAKFPRLQAPPGARILARHTENGHVSKPDASDAFSGYTYWYGTSSPSPRHTLQNALDWTSDGKGGRGDGIFLGRGTYDDGKCAEPNDTPISKARGVGSRGKMKDCIDSFKLPEGLKPGTTYTVYWVWDFSGHFGSKAPKHIEVCFFHILWFEREN
jgi:hypothetical protein